MRPLRRRLTRRRFRRADVPSSAATTPPPGTRPIRCMCGTLHEIAPEDHGRRKSCSTCRRRFEVEVAYNMAAGANDLSIHYLTEQNARTGETCIIGSATTVAGAPALPSGPPAEPEPPPDTLFNCACGALLLVQKKHYERRASCPECRARMMIFMLFDPATGTFSLQTFSLVGAPTNQTQVLPKL